MAGGKLALAVEMGDRLVAAIQQGQGAAGAVVHQVEVGMRFEAAFGRFQGFARQPDIGEGVGDCIAHLRMAGIERQRLFGHDPHPSHFRGIVVDQEIVESRIRHRHERLGQGVVGRRRHRVSAGGDGLHERGAVEIAAAGDHPHDALPGGEIRGLAQDAFDLEAFGLHPQAPRHVLDQIVLQVGEAVERALEALAPHDGPARGVDRLGGDEQGLGRPANVALQEVAHAQLAHQGVDVDPGGAGEARGHRAGDNAEIGAGGERLGDVLHHPEGEDLVLGHLGAVAEGQHGEQRRLSGVRPPGFDLRRRRASRRSGGFFFAANLAAHIGEKPSPRVILGLAMPVAEVGRMGQFEHHRPLAVGDHRRQQGVAAVRLGGFGPHPAGDDRPRRPQHDHRLGGLQRPLGDFVVGLAGAQIDVPPDIEAFGGERFGEDLGAGRILTAVGEEDIRHHAPTRRRQQTGDRRTASPRPPG